MPTHIPPSWRIFGPDEPPPPRAGEPGLSIRIAPGEGWGTGAHETTRLCLQALGRVASQFPPRPWRMLDFGSGSAILSIGAARLGGRAVGVEIDEAGLAHGAANCELNEVGERVSFHRSLDDAPGPFELVVANILRPVLLEFASGLASRLAPGGALILSGLVATDVPDVSVRYAGLLGGAQPEVYRRGDWRALVWAPRPPSGIRS